MSLDDAAAGFDASGSLGGCSSHYVATDKLTKLAEQARNATTETPISKLFA